MVCVTGGLGLCVRVEKTRSQKMLVNRAEFPASNARGVVSGGIGRWEFIFKTTTEIK